MSGNFLNSLKAIFCKRYERTFVWISFAGTCSEPGGKKHAIRSGPTWPYEVRSQITYTCNECHVGGGTATCQYGGQWSNVYECTGQCSKLVNESQIYKTKSEAVALLIQKLFNDTLFY